MLDTDIYDFAEILLQYETDSEIVVLNIFVDGTEKVNMYANYNPEIYKCATRINPDTEQGVQYLGEMDIKYMGERERVYRYWKCGRTSKTDERFSHFSELERIGK